MENRKRRLVIIGAGAAGLMAAVAALEYFHEIHKSSPHSQKDYKGFRGTTGIPEVLVLEKTKRPGRKLRISGKGRGNLTNAAAIADFIGRYPGNGRFLHSVLTAFTNDDVRDFFARLSVETKIERGGRVFPVSDKAGDLVDALVKAVTEKGGIIETGATVSEILTDGGQNAVSGVKLKNRQITADAVIIATGGLSYPLTGSTGDGYRFAKSLGHKITRPFPALVPLKCLEADDLAALDGVTLKNVQASLFIGGKKIGGEFGEIAALDGFLAGAAILKLSRQISEAAIKNGAVDAKITIDLKPALNGEKLAARLERDIAGKENLTAGNLLRGLFPAALATIVARRLGINPNLAAKRLTQETRRFLLKTVKEFHFTITGTAPADLAIVTAGGVTVKEIVPQTMASKFVRGLYFAGEVVDIDGYTGGLQPASGMVHRTRRRRRGSGLFNPKAGESMMEANQKQADEKRTF